MALDNLKRVDMPLNKETKPNQTKPNFLMLLTLIIISINHLFAHSLNGFKYYYLSTMDPQSLLPSIFKIKKVECLFATRAI